MIYYYLLSKKLNLENSIERCSIWLSHHTIMFPSNDKTPYGTIFKVRKELKSYERKLYWVKLIMRLLYRNVV